MKRNFDAFALRRPRVANFADIKIATTFIKNLLRLEKSENNLKLCIKMQSISVFLEVTKVVAFLGKNADVSRTQEVYHVVYMFFGSSLCKL